MSVSSTRKTKSNTKSRDTTRVSKSKQKKSCIDNEDNEIKVYLRIRPFSSSETNESNIISIQDDKIVSVKPPIESLAHKAGDYQEHRFTFNRIFDPNSSQNEVFDNAIFPELKNIINGFNDTNDDDDDIDESSKNNLFVTYGCSGTGKSYTIHGDSSTSSPGMVDFILSDVFSKIESYKSSFDEIDENDRLNHVIFLSYVEIYNEKIYDLLSSNTSRNTSKNDNTTRTPLKLQYDKNMKPVLDAKERTAKDLKHAKEIIRIGNLARQCASTAVNHVSSRSHALLTIKILSMPLGLPKKQLLKNPEKYLKVKKLAIVDMAGNERTKKSKVSGSQMAVTSKINTSLMVFRNCIEVLKSNQHSTSSSKNSIQNVVPFRESKLTILLKEYLTGQGKTSMIVCASPCGSVYDETINSLKFSSIAKEVRSVPIPSTPKQIRDKNNEVKQEIQNLRKELFDIQNQYCILESSIRKEYADDIKLQFNTLLQSESTLELHDKTQELSTIDIISQVNHLYQNRIKELYDNDDNDDDDDNNMKDESEYSKLLNDFNELVNELDNLKKSKEESRRKLCNLKIKSNNNCVENDQLKEQISSLENTFIQLKENHFEENSTSVSQDEYNSILDKLEKALKKQSKYKESLVKLQEEQESLNDKKNSLDTVLKAQISKNIKNEESSSNHHHHKGNRGNTPTRAIEKVIGMITPKSSSSSSKKKIPTKLTHNNSSGTMNTWYGNINPSVTGNGISVSFDNIEKTETLSASSYLKNEKLDFSPVNSKENVFSSPKQVLLTPNCKKHSSTLKSSSKFNNTIKIPTFESGISMSVDISSSEDYKKEKSSNEFQLVGKKRVSSESFSEIFLEEFSPPTKKLRI